MDKKLIGFIALSTTLMLTACQSSTNNTKSQGNGQAQTLGNKERISNGIKADYRIADELAKINGLRGPAVLIHNNQAYVGVHVIGDEINPDPYMKKGPGTYTSEQPPKPGVPGVNRGPQNDSGRNLVPNMQAPSLDGDSPNNAAVREAPGKMSTQTGNIDPQLVQQIRAKVKAMAPYVNDVFVTANNSNVSKLQGYARFIQDGSDMTPFVDRFRSTVKQIWPDSKP